MQQMTTRTAEDFDDDVLQGDIELEEEELDVPPQAAALEEEDEETGDKPEPQEQAPGRFVFNGEAYDEDLRGMSAEEASRTFTQLKTASRVLAEQLSQRNRHDAPAAPVVPEEPPDITLDDLSTDGAINEKVQKIFEAKAAPFIQELQALRAQAAQSSAMNAYQAAMADNGLPYLRKYKSEVDAIVQRMPVQSITAASMRQIHANLIQEHFDEVAEDRARVQRGPTPPISEGVKGRGDGRTPRLTPDQRRVARMLGVSDKDYAKMIPSTNQG
jgi:hypothetical protein